MRKGKTLVLVLSLLIGSMAVGGVLTIRRFKTAYAFADTEPPIALEQIKMVSYSCSGGSVAEQSFFYSMQKEDEKILYSCEYSENSHDIDDHEKVVVEDAEVPAEFFNVLIQLLADIKFPSEQIEKNHEIIVLDAETYSLTVYYTSGRIRNLDSYFSINEIEIFFREIDDAWKIDSKQKSG